MTNYALPKRSAIDAKYKWKLEDIYDSVEKWEEDFAEVKVLCGEIVKYSGSLGQSATKLQECLNLSDDMLSLTDNVYVYARMKRDEDNSDPVYQALTDRAAALSTEVYSAVSFIVPEIISIPEDVLSGYLSSNENLSVYRQVINEALRQKKHILSDKEEKIIAMSYDLASASKDIFTMFNNADIKFPYVKDEDGNEIELTKGRYIKLLESKDRGVRENSFHALYDTYKKQKNTLAATLASNVKSNRFYSSVRNYESALQASLDEDNIHVDVYNNLISTINSNLHLLHRYLKLRKRALKLDKLHMFDLYAPIVEQSNKNIAYKDALDTVINGLNPLGEEYIGLLKNAFESGWIDVFENEGKTSGAYSWGSYKSHPYVLLNFQGTTNDVFTIAHEMGHALHSYYTNKNQPYTYSQYKIFVAEVASTVNESLLMKFLLEKTTDKNEKAYLLNHYLEEFRGTIFRQVMFAEFEKIIHEKLENGEALTPQTFCTVYRELNLKYFGCEVEVDEDIDMEWARIPHFYSSFYVYKYATGFSAAASISQSILDEGKPAVDRYKEFLKSGSSDYPIELLKKAGVDLSTPKPVQDALDVFNKILAELEAIID
ncbi:MAG: oligoendopeptidase F [Bacillota bacterium]|nr:oligoendopeptidase F [Bacillota bacterium]